MSDAKAEARTAGSTVSRGRTVFAMLFAVVAIGFFAAAFVYANGMTYVDKLIAGFSNMATPAPGTSQSVQSVAASSTAAATSTAGASSALPAVSDAMRGSLFYEQISSQASITDLVNSEFTALTVDSVSTTADSATLRVTATHKQLSAYRGTLVFVRSGDMWLFKSISRDGVTGVLPTHPAVDSAIVDAVIQQHVVNQAVLKDLFAGGYKTLTATGIQKGPNTATIQVTMSGGTKPDRKGDVLLICKNLEGTTYWFITAFR
jgi:hypothetical protein